MQFHRGVLQGGEFVQGVPSGWDWKIAGGSYRKGRDFFSVHWEVQVRDPLNVRLHVESPRHNVDPKLNGIKKDIVVELLKSEAFVVADALRYGLGYERGSRTSLAKIEGNKSTEAFRIILADGKKANKSEQDISTVHNVVGVYVATIIAQFAPVLDGLLPR